MQDMLYFLIQSSPHHFLLIFVYYDCSWEFAIIHVIFKVRIYRP